MSVKCNLHCFIDGIESVKGLDWCPTLSLQYDRYTLSQTHMRSQPH